MQIRRGNILGALIGLAFGNVIGAIIGWFIGGFFEKGLLGLSDMADPAQRATIQDVFFRSTFTLMGRLAKSDGRVSEEEIQHTEQAMERMGLSVHHRRQAIELFRQGAAQDLAIDQVLAEFRQHCGQYGNLRQLLLVNLIGLAMADGELHQAEEELLRQIAERIGYSRAAFEQLISMIRAQDQFGRQDSSRQRENQLDLAYQALGVSPTATDKEVKRAYRKLMSQYHPDKLMGQGVPEDMIKTATQRSQEVQTAYDLIKKHRHH